MNIADMTIHIPQDLHPVNQERLEDELRELEGVSAAHFNYRIKNWLMVVYEPESTNPRNILNQVRQWDKNAVFF